MQITQELLKKLFLYGPETGHFIRLISTSSRARKGNIAGYLSSDGYWMITVNGMPQHAHRLAWVYTFGRTPVNEIDHINHNRTDNRIENLREATRTMNERNRTMSKNNTSGHNGIYRPAGRKKWEVQLWINGKKFRGGYFYNIDEAIKARDKLYKKHSFHKNHGKVMQ